jgi:hypothetical protein
MVINLSSLVKLNQMIGYLTKTIRNGLAPRLLEDRRFLFFCQYYCKMWLMLSFLSDYILDEAFINAS